MKYIHEEKKNITSSLSLMHTHWIVTMSVWSQEFGRNIKLDSGMVLGGTNRIDNPGVCIHMQSDVTVSSNTS